MSEQATAEFALALRQLHALIGIELDVDLWFHDRFFAVDFIARLERVETLPSSESVIAYFDNGVQIDLAPGELVPRDAEGALAFTIGEEMILELRPSSLREAN